jgi:uncharacterized protein (TIGR02996 family)
MTDHDALVAAVCAQPGEDTPRLAYADYLDELGSKESTVRAAYIRGAIRLAREERWTPTWREHKEKTDRAEDTYRELAGKNRLPWVAHLKGRVAAWDFERGFVGHITVYAKRFLEEGDDYFANDPIQSVKFVKLTAKGGSVPPAELLDSPYLARAAKLSFDGSRLRDEDLERLADSRAVHGLRSLSLGTDNPFTPSVVPKLLKNLKALGELSCVWNTAFGDEHARSLAKCKDFSRLTVLDLNRAAVSGAGVASIVASPYAAGLARLAIAPELDRDLEGHPRPSFIRPTRKEGVRIAGAIASSKSLKRLRALDLRGRLIGDDGLTLLAKSRALPALRELRLGGNKIGPEGIRILAESPIGQRLLYLELDSSAPLRACTAGLRKMLPNTHVEAHLDFDE